MEPVRSHFLFTRLPNRLPSFQNSPNQIIPTLITSTKSTKQIASRLNTKPKPMVHMTGYPLPYSNLIDNIIWIIPPPSPSTPSTLSPSPHSHHRRRRPLSSRHSVSTWYMLVAEEMRQIGNKMCRTGETTREVECEQLKNLDSRVRDFGPKDQSGNPLGTQSSGSVCSTNECRLSQPKTIRTIDLTSYEKSKSETPGSQDGSASPRSGSVGDR
jgi:hypothetical protein